ncbi:unnamed protein product, partial [Effrenium voratum]
SNVTKADLAAAVVEQLCGLQSCAEPSSSSTPAVTIARLREVVAAKGDQGPAALRALLRPLKLRDASPSLTGLATDLGVDVTGLTRHAIIQRLETLEARIEVTLGEDQCAEFRHGLLAVFLGITVEAVAGKHLSARDELQLLDAKLSEAAACVPDMEQWLPQSIPPSWTAAVTRLQETTMPRLSWPAQHALLAVVSSARWNERRGWWRLAGASDCADPIDVAERLWALATLEQEAASEETDGFKDRKEALEAVLSAVQHKYSSRSFDDGDKIVLRAFM